MARTALAVLTAMLVWACVQEEYQPTAKDLEVIKKNLLLELPRMKFPVDASLE
jgi:hypothetical protein